MVYSYSKFSIIFLTLLFFSQVIFAQTSYTWSGGNSDWHTAANWTPNGVPGAADNVVINNGDVAVNSDVSVASLELNSGNINGSGKITVTTTLNWFDGRLEGSGEIVIPAGATFSLDNNNAKELNGRNIRNEGTLIFDGNGDLRMKGGSQIINTSLFEIRNTALIDSLAPDGGSIVNSGTINKLSDTGVARLDVRVTNSGTIQVSSGTLKLSLSSTHTGTLTTSTDAFLEFSDGSHVLDGRTLSGNGGYIISSAIVNTVGNTTLAATASFSMDGSSAHFTGDGDFIANGPFSWERGTMSGNGNLVINATLDMISNNAKTLDTRHLNNNGTINFNGTGEFRLKNGSIFNNASGKTVTFASDADIAFATPGGGTFVNNGTFAKNTADGVTVMEVAFTNTGSVNIASGQFKLENGSTNSGNYDVASGSMLELNGGAHVLENGSSLSGAGDLAFSAGDFNFSGTHSGSGNIYINGGTANLNSGLNGSGTLIIGNGDVNINTPISVSELTVDGGFLTIDNALTVNGQFSWSDGTITGASSLNLNGDILLSSNNTKNLDGVTIDNANTLTWQGDGDLRMKNSAALINQAGAVMDIQGNAVLDSIAPGGGTFQSDGTLLKSAGGGLTLIDASFNGSGIVEVQSGTLRFAKKSVIDASTTIGTGANLQFANTLHQITNPNFSGGGTVQISNATLLALGSSLSVGANTTLFISQSSSNLEGDVAVTIDGTLDWERGFIRTTGAFTINGIMNLIGNSARTLEGITLTNNGAINWSGSGDFRLKDGCEIVNQSGATFTMNDAAELSFIDPTGGVFTNNGSIIRDGNAGTAVFETALTNNGSIILNTGVLQLEAASTHTGAVIDGQAGGALALIDADHNFDAATQFSGGHTLAVLGGTTTLNGTFGGSSSLDVSGGAAVLANGATFNDIYLKSASITVNSGNINISNMFIWESGTFTGSGALTVGTYLEMLGDGDKRLEGWAMTLNGIGEWGGGSGDFKLRNGSSFTIANNSSLDITGDGELAFDSGGGGTFINNGDIVRRDNPNTTTVSTTVTNTGTIHLQDGSLKLIENSSHANLSAQLDSGTVFLLISGDHTFSNANIDGAGTLEMDDATITADGGFTIDGDVTLLMTQSNSVLSSNDAITINGNLAWERGTIDGSGAFTVNGGLMVGGNHEKVLDGKTLNFHGSGHWRGIGNFQLKNNALLAVREGANWEIQDDAELDFAAPNGGSLENYGSIVKTDSAGATVINVPFQNRGVLDIRKGKVKISNALTNDSSGVIQGSGILDVSSISFLNEGTVAPGSSPGILTIEGVYNQAASGHLNIELGGVTPGDTYDRLVVTNTANLDGEVTINLVNNFFASIGDQFEVLTANSRVGQFATVNNNAIGGHVSFDIAYSDSSFLLTVTDFSNIAPVAMDDDATTDEDVSSLIDVLNNDNDGDSDPLVVDTVFQALHGEVSIETNMIRYTPDANFFGQDSFRYAIIDGFGGADTATVVVEIISVNDLPVISGLPTAISFAGDSSVVLNLWDFVSDVETADDLLTYTITTSNNNLLHSFNNGNGNLTISAASGFAGDAQLGIEISDPQNGFDQDTIQVTVQPVVGITPEPIATAERFELGQNYPNPFNPSTSIRFQLAEPGRAVLNIFNVLGQKIRTLVDDHLPAGSHEVRWDARNDIGEPMGSGVYIYQLISGKHRQVRKMMFLK